MNNEESLTPADMDPEDLPDVPAFQDEFTREFLESTEPTREGYYPFLSKTGSYTMDFPEDMVISEKSYNSGPDNRSEIVVISHKDDQKKVYVNHVINYYSYMASSSNSKEEMSKSANKNLNFKELPTDGNNQHLEVAEFEANSFIGLASLIWNDSNEEIQIFTDITCTDDSSTNSCIELVEDEKKEIVEIFKSIRFVQQESE